MNSQNILKTKKNLETCKDKNNIERHLFLQDDWFIGMHASIGLLYCKVVYSWVV